jgi:outer membrane protein insertion porin family
LGNSPDDTCDPLRAGRYLCDALGNRLSSIVGSSLVYRSLDNAVHPTRGSIWALNLDVAGLGGSVRYAKLRGNYAHYWPLGGGWIFSVNAEGGYVKGFGHRDPGEDPVRLTDRFFLGEPNMRGFDIRGVGPRIIREGYNTAATGGTVVPVCADETQAADCSAHGGYSFLPTDPNNLYQDALGGDIYYLGKVELEIPLGSGAKELGLRPSIFTDIGSVFHVTKPQLIDTGPTVCSGLCANGQPLYIDNKGTTDTADDQVVATPPDPANPIYAGTLSPGFHEVFLGDTWKPRLSVGIGVNWKSPFGPFRIDFAKVLLKQKGDDTKAFSFNVGTQF